MSTSIGVVRYHLVNRVNYLVVPGSWLLFALAVDLVIFALIPVHPHVVMTASGPVHDPGTAGRDAYGLFAVVAVFFALGVQSVARSLPFALALGLSRRSYYNGTVLLAATLAVGYGLLLTGFQGIERATGGWGLSTNVFRVPYILDGPWYLTWLTSSVALALMFAWGMWVGIVYRRWSLVGALIFAAGQITVLLAAGALITWSHTWAGFGHFFTTLSAAGLTGVLAALVVVLLGGGYATLRSVTV